jgi:hypothetical protein
MGKFDELQVPETFQQYYSKYPQGYTLIEALLNWVESVNGLTGNVNDWNTYLDNFVEDFDTNLQEKTGISLQEFIDNGTLGGLINGGLLSDINSQLGAKASQAALDVINTQISTLIANSGNTSASASEIQDGRLTSFNKTWDTLGNRLRNNDDFATYSRTLSTDYVALMPTLASNSYVDKTTKVLTANSNYLITKPYKCVYSDEFLVTTNLSGSNAGFAVLYDNALNILEVLQPYGDGTTNARSATIRVTNVNAAFIAFQSMSNTRSTLLIRKKKAKTTDLETWKRSKGYYHVNAKARAGMTDRAQIWLTYDLGSGATVKDFNIPFEIISNVSGLSFRVYGGLTPTTYEAQMDYYSAWIGEGIYNYIGSGYDSVLPNDPTTTTPTRYFQLFLDILLTDITKAGEINIGKFKVNGLTANHGKIKFKYNNNGYLRRHGTICGTVPAL